MLEYPAIESRYELAALYEKTEAAVSLRKYKRTPGYMVQLRRAILDADAVELRASTDREKRKARLMRLIAQAELADLQAGAKPSALSGYIALKLPD